MKKITTGIQSQQSIRHVKTKIRRRAALIGHGDRFVDEGKTKEEKLVDPKKFPGKLEKKSTQESRPFLSRLKKKLGRFTAFAMAATAAVTGIATPAFAQEAPLNETQVQRSFDEAGGVTNPTTDDKDKRTIEDKQDPSRVNKGSGFDLRADDAFKAVIDSNYETQIGDYNLRVDYADFDIDLKPRLKPRLNDGKLGLEGKLYLKGEMDLLRTELSKTEQQGDWTVTQGLRGSIDTELKVGYEGEWTDGDDEVDYESFNEPKVHLNMSGFKRWDRDLEDGKRLRLDLVGGVGQNVLDGDTKLHLQARQELAGGDLTIYGHKFTWVTEAKEGLEYHVQDDNFNAKYELFGGLIKKIPMKVFGQKFETEIKAGPRIKGDIDEPIEFSPVFKVKVRF